MVLIIYVYQLAVVRIMLHVIGWVPGKQALRWRFSCSKFISGVRWDQYLWKRREGSRIEQREKVGYSTVRMKASVDSMGCSEELSHIRVKGWAFTLLHYWVQAAPGRRHGLA